MDTMGSSGDPGTETGLPNPFYKAPMSRGKRIWRAARWPIYTILIAYIALVIYRIPAVDEQARTKDAVAFIHSQKITLDDVMGKNIPHIPDATISSTTIAGVDENRNGIRDDVEIWILENHFPSARIRAAEMQYALALQLELTQVFNSGTLVAASQEASRGLGCLFESAAASTLIERNTITRGLMSEVENLMLNTEIRKQKRNSVFEKYMVSHGDIEGQDCDIVPSTLPN